MYFSFFFHLFSVPIFSTHVGITYKINMTKSLTTFFENDYLLYIETQNSDTY